MKASDDAEYTLIYDGREDPTVLTFSTTNGLDHLGDPIVPRTYLFKVQARNWVGIGSNSNDLNVTIQYLSDP
jgi:hypothetical protein